MNSSELPDYSQLLHMSLHSSSLYVHGYDLSIPRPDFAMPKVYKCVECGKSHGKLWVSALSWNSQKLYCEEHARVADDYFIQKFPHLIEDSISINNTMRAVNKHLQCKLPHIFSFFVPALVNKLTPIFIISRISRIPNFISEYWNILPQAFDNSHGHRPGTLGEVMGKITIGMGMASFNGYGPNDLEKVWKI